jgi:hypothetical protein
MHSRFSFRMKSGGGPTVYGGEQSSVFVGIDAALAVGRIVATAVVDAVTDAMGCTLWLAMICGWCTGPCGFFSAPASIAGFGSATDKVAGTSG